MMFPPSPSVLIRTRAVWAFVVFGLSACREVPTRTQVIVFVEADQAIREAATQLRIRIEHSADEAPFNKRVSDPEWPLKLVLAPARDDASREYRLLLSPADDASTSFEVELRSGFVPNRARFVRLVLTARCLGRHVSPLEHAAETFGSSAPEAVRLEPCDQPEDSPEGGSPDGAAADGSNGDDDDGGLPACAAGYQPSDAGCVDIDECSDSSRCGEHGGCLNTEGGHICQCDLGYESRDGSCQLQGACRTDNGGCEQRCVELPVGSRCECTGGGFIRADGTSCGHWRAPETLELGSATNVERLRLAVSSTGQALALWLQPAGEDTHVWASHFAPDTSWGRTLRVTPEGPYWARSAQVTIDDAGEGLAVWHQSYMGQENTWGTSFVDSGWGTPVLLQQGTTASSHVGPSLAGNSKGDAIAVWASFAGRGTGIVTSRYDAASSRWSESVGLDYGIATGPFAVTAPSIAIADDSTAMTTWLMPAQGPGANSLADRVWMNESTPQAPVGVPMPVDHYDPTRQEPSAPQVVMTSNDNAFIVWVQRDADGLGIFANRYQRDSGWATEQKLHALSDGIAVSDLHVAAGRSGVVMAVWIQVSDLREDVYASRWSVSSGWEPAQRLEALTDGRSHAPQVAGDAAGSFVAVWSRSDGLREDVWSNRWSPRGGWGTAVVLETEPGDASEPQIGLDARGGALAVWRQSNGSSLTLRASAFE